MSSELEKVAATLREYALGLPEAQEDFPWGESVVKVNKKIFVFLGRAADMPEKGLGLTVKLPVSAMDALQTPGAEPTGYGLGKAGWVTMRFPAGECPPAEFLERWIEESYRAIAPKRLAARLDAPGQTEAAKAAPEPRSKAARPKKG